MASKSRFAQARSSPRGAHRGRRTTTGLGRRVRAWRGPVRALVVAVWTSPPAVRLPVLAALLILFWLGSNWLYHAFQKPTELFFPLDRSLSKSPRETWQRYGSLFREHATTIMTPELLAALAQVEGAGNPLARTYWRWDLTTNPLEVYKPASSAVGMYQITDATLREAQRYCVHDHAVVTDGPWNEVRSCWFNSLYFRVVPSHAIELTAAFLDRSVASALQPRRAATRAQKEDLAALIHLCGSGAGRAYAARGFKLTPHQRCGDHDVHDYLARVNALKRQFSALADPATPRLVRDR